MKNLIQDVLDIESRANTMIDQAHAEAKSITDAVAAETAQYRQGLEQQLAQRLDAHRAAASQRYEQALTGENEAHARALAHLAGISTEVIRSQAQLAAERYREL